MIRRLCDHASKGLINRFTKSAPLRLRPMWSAPLDDQNAVSSGRVSQIIGGFKNRQAT